MLALKLIHVTALYSCSLTDFHPWSECDENRGISAVVKHFFVIPVPDSSNIYRPTHERNIVSYVNNICTSGKKTPMLLDTTKTISVCACLFPQPVVDLTWRHCMKSQASSMSAPCPAPGNTPCGIRRRKHFTLTSIPAQCGPLYGLTKHCFELQNNWGFVLYPHHGATCGYSLPKMADGKNIETGKPSSYYVTVYRLASYLAWAIPFIWIICRPGFRSRE